MNKTPYFTFAGHTLIATCDAVVLIRTGHPPVLFVPGKQPVVMTDATKVTPPSDDD